MLAGEARRFHEKTPILLTQITSFPTRMEYHTKKRFSCQNRKGCSIASHYSIVLTRNKSKLQLETKMK